MLKSQKKIKSHLKDILLSKNVGSKHESKAQAPFSLVIYRIIKSGQDYMTNNPFKYS